jgi:hypothetical protein
MPLQSKPNHGTGSDIFTKEVDSTQAILDYLRKFIAPRISEKSLKNDVLSSSSPAELMQKLQTRVKHVHANLQHLNYHEVSTLYNILDEARMILKYNDRYRNECVDLLTQAEKNQELLQPLLATSAPYSRLGN